MGATFPGPPGRRQNPAYRQPVMFFKVLEVFEQALEMPVTMLNRKFVGEGAGGDQQIGSGDRLAGSAGFLAKGTGFFPDGIRHLEQGDIGFQLPEKIGFGLVLDALP